VQHVLARMGENAVRRDTVIHVNVNLVTMGNVVRVNMKTVVNAFEDGYI